MSEADELFDELGYEKKHDNKRHVVYRYSLGEIEFKLKNKLIFVDFGLDMQELQAIYKKCKELRLDMTVREFLKDILNKKTRKKKIQIRYGAGYYTFYVEDFEFINNTNGTGLVIGKILDDEIEVL